MFKMWIAQEYISVSESARNRRVGKGEPFRIVEVLEHMVGPWVDNYLTGITTMQMHAPRDQAVCFSDVDWQDMRHYCRNDADFGQMSSKGMK